MTSISLDLNDPRSELVGEVMANKTCRRILSALSEKELTQAEIATHLGAGMSTVDYAVKKLIAAGLIETYKSFFSSKGKKVVAYRVAHKRIIISPRPIVKGVLPALGITALIAFGIKLFQTPTTLTNSKSVSLEASGTMADSTLYTILEQAPQSWAWFFIGACVALIIFLLWNWERK